MQIFNLFPLTVIKDNISIEEKEREILVNEIKKMKNIDSDKKTSSYAWTGDINGHEFLFSNDLFKNLSTKFLK